MRFLCTAKTQIFLYLLVNEETQNVVAKINKNIVLDRG